MKKIALKYIVTAVLLSLLLAACGGAPATAPALEPLAPPDEVIAEGRLEPFRAVNLSFQARGLVEDVSVKKGDAVSAGDVLARLANAGAAEAQVVSAQNAYATLLRNADGARAQLWQAYLAAQKARAAAEKKWDDLNVDDIEDRIEDDKAVVEDRTEDLKDAQKDFDKYKDLDQDNSKRKSAEDKLKRAQKDLNQANRDLEEEQRKRDDARAAYDLALANEAEAKHQYEISLDGPNAEQLALAKANLKAAQDALANYVITAPFGGVVAEVNVQAGQEVGPETRAVSVADYSSWIVKTTDVTELEAVKIKLGQKVSMLPDALPDLTLTGTVTEISDAYTLQGGDVLYTVRVRVDNPAPTLRWGMTVEATFLAGE